MTNGLELRATLPSLLTAWYDGVIVVILCRFLAYSKKNNLTFSAICASVSGDRRQVQRD